MENNIEITENAQEHIAQVLKNDKAKYFRITVLGGGCAGFQYKFEFDNSRNKEDIVFKTEKIEVLIDNISVEESGEFHPDVDVRTKIGQNLYGRFPLTRYIDKNINPMEYKENSAPLEAQFYFYPTYPTNQIFDISRTPMYNDFKKGLFYIYDIDWGDGSEIEYTDEPVQLGYDTIVGHTLRQISKQFTALLKSEGTVNVKVIADLEYHVLIWLVEKESLCNI